MRTECRVSSPRCLGEQVVERRDGREVATCCDHNRRAIYVTHASERGDIVCTATWSTSAPLAESRKQDAADVEAACLTLRFL